MEVLRTKLEERNEIKDGYLPSIAVQGIQLKTETKDTESLTNWNFLGAINNLPHERVGAENYLQLSDVLISK